METIKASHITQIRTYLRIDPRDIRNERTTHLCHNNVAIKHSATMAQIGKFAAAAASVIPVAYHLLYRQTSKTTAAAVAALWPILPIFKCYCNGSLWWAL